MMQSAGGVGVLLVGASAALACTFLYARPSFVSHPAPSVYLDLTGSALTLYRLGSKGPIRDPGLVPSYGPTVTSSGTAPVAKGWYFVDGRLLYTDWSLRIDSVLWTHWRGYHLNRQRLLLRGWDDDKNPDDTNHPTWSLPACTTGGGVPRAGCTFPASVPDQEVNVTLFVNGPVTYVPTAIWGEATTHDRLDITWVDPTTQTRTVTIPGPFAPHSDLHAVYVSSDAAGHAGAWSVFPGQHRAAVTPYASEHSLPRGTGWASLLATTAVVLGTGLAVYGWTTPAASPVKGLVPATAALVYVVATWTTLAGPALGTIWVWISAVASVRSMRSTRTRGGPRVPSRRRSRGSFPEDAPGYYFSPVFGGLEAVWVATMYLHDDEVNFTSLVTSMAAATTAIFYALDAKHDAKERSHPPPNEYRVLHVLWAVFATVLCVVFNVWPYLNHHGRALYGMWSLPATVFVPSVMMEIALHLR